MTTQIETNSYSRLNMGRVYSRDLRYVANTSFVLDNNRFTIFRIK